MYRFAVRPRWILSHLLVLVLVAACISAGIWQLSRLSEKREVIHQFEERAQFDPVPIAQLLSVESDASAVETVTHRQVTVVGKYLQDEEITVRNRTRDGAPGYWVLTPVVLHSGEVVVINRGWVPLLVGRDLDELAEFTTPRGEIEVIGTVTAAETRGSFGSVDPEEGHLRDLARADIGRIADQIDAPVYPAYVTLSGQQPMPSQLPIPVTPVPPDEGPHLGYAAQWFIFATIAIIGYPLILRKVAGERASKGSKKGTKRYRSRLVPIDD